MQWRTCLAALLSGGLAAFAAPHVGHAQPTAVDKPDPACVARPDCRFVGSVTVMTNQGVKTPALDRNMPFLRATNGGLKLWLVIGERVVFRLGGPGEPALVVLSHGRASDPETPKADLKDRIEIDFAQLGGSVFTMMAVHNGYARTLRYKAFLLTQHGGEIPTSACAVLPGIMSMENWQQPLLEIELGDFQLTDSGSMVVSCN